ncbi:MAG: hypothetical protein Q8Q09_06035 [Deltaproteobacteria bacterium]|nr:hypothetical protein [Deltaproteobacteria bacterium]
MNKPRTALHSDSSNDHGNERGEAFPPVYPLFADHDPPLPLGIIDYLVVQRVLDDSAVRPGADKRTRYKVWPERFDPLSTDEITIAEHCGGGMYDVRAVGAKGRTVAGCRLELEGAPKEFVPDAPGGEPRPLRAGYGAPVEQAAPGVLSVRGLDPNVQAMLAMMQANNERQEKQLEAQRLAVREEAQRARDDARQMNETMVRMVEATVKGSAPPVPMDAQLISGWINRIERDRDREIERIEKRQRREDRGASDEGSGLEKIVEQVPMLLGAMPAFQARLAELVQPMLKESAKEIVAGVLNDMAKTGGTG